MIVIQIHGVAKIVNRVPQRGQKTLFGALIDLQFRQIIAGDHTRATFHRQLGRGSRKRLTRRGTTSQK
jgi:hypothetical protein